MQLLLARGVHSRSGTAAPASCSTHCWTRCCPTPCTGRRYPALSVSAHSSLFPPPIPSCERCRPQHFPAGLRRCCCVLAVSPLTDVCSRPADGISPLARHDAMVALNGTPMQPNDVETFASAKTCMSGTVQQKIACWGDKKRTVWATSMNGPVGNEYP